MALPTRRSYSGAADGCTLTSAISAGDTSATLTGTVTNWPVTNLTAPFLPFYMVIDPGLAAEEKVLVTLRNAGNLTITRAQDGTTAAAHATGAVAYPVGAAVDFDEANSALSKMTTKGDLLVTTGSAYARLPVGTDTYALLADSGAANGVAWGQIAAGGIATGAVTSDKILNDTIMNVDINSAAAIAYSKLNLATSIVNADVSTSAAIALSKLATTGTLTATTFVGALTGNATTATSATNATTSTLQTKGFNSTAIATTSFVEQQTKYIAYSTTPSAYSTSSVSLTYDTVMSCTGTSIANHFTNIIINLQLEGYSGNFLFRVLEDATSIFETLAGPIVGSGFGTHFGWNFVYNTTGVSHTWYVQIARIGSVNVNLLPNPTAYNQHQIFVYDAGAV